MSEIARIFPPERPVHKRPVHKRPVPEGTVPERPAPEPLWREVLGTRLRALRGERDETLAQTADRAGISPQYLSEIERGRKEPSSEMIAALAGALGISVAELMAGAAEDLRQNAAVVLTIATSAGNLSMLPTRHRQAGQAAQIGPAAPASPAGPVALAMAA